MPEDADSLNQLGIRLLGQGRAAEAEEAFRKLIGLLPAAAPAHANLGQALRLQNRGTEAVAAFRTAVELAPEVPQNHLQLFKQLQQLSRWDEAVAVLEAGVFRHPRSELLNEALAVAYGRLGRREDAERIFEQTSHSSPSAANSYAQWLQYEGRFEDSVPLLRRSLGLQPIQGVPYRLLVEARKSSLDGKPLLEMALKLIEDPKLDDSSRMHLSYALGKLYEQGKEFEAAMGSFDAANEIAYKTYPACRTFDPVWTSREPDLIADLYSRELLERLSPSGNPDPRPIFIVGMIRSGTTLLDQIVSSHPDVVGVGEGSFWNAEADAIHPRWQREAPTASELESLAERYLKSVPMPDTAKRFTDKMPLNYRNLGPIHAVFPETRILHIRRDPFDTCLSIYTTFFAGGPSFAYSKENIVAFYRAYERYMDHWRKTLPPDRFFELDYESLVTNPEPLSREVIEFLGLPWDDACLRHDRNSGQISTPSRWQARQPVYTTSMGKRAHYGEFAGAFQSL